MSITKNRNSKNQSESFLSALFIRFCFLFIFFNVNLLFADPATIQQIPDARTIYSLDTQENHTWWIRGDAIDIKKESAEILSRFGHKFDIKKDSLPDPFAQDAKWKKAKVPGNASGNELPLGVTYAVYAKAILLPKKIDKALAIKVGEINDRDRVYFNGVLIGQHGDWQNELAQGYDKQRLYEIPFSLLRPGDLNFFLVEVKGLFPHDLGIIKNSTEIGPARQMWHDFYIGQFVAILFLIIYITVGSYFLFLFIRLRSEWQNFFFAIFSYLLVIYQFLRNQLKYNLDVDFYFLKKTEYIILFLLVPIIYYFFRIYFSIPKNKFFIWMDRFFLGVNSVVGAMIVILFFSTSAVTWDTINKTVIMPTWIFYIAGILIVLLYQAKKKNQDAFYFLLGLITVVLAMVVDILQTYGFINTPRIMGYAFFFFILSLAVILANRFVRLHEEIEDLNKNLELKVEERTRQLQETLNEVRTLKVQQDGDYFLTTLLIKPLGGNFADSRVVDIDFLVRQKKRFEFKGREHEIGGDLCISHSLKLRGRDYTFFVNADAMGKSIQGAGGALVLGVVLKSIIARTEMLPEFYERYPEQWLKSCFIELQNVFVTFEGSMMISLILGLVDDRTGLLYLVNAEHPWTVLYRQGKASFLENELFLRKVGIEGLENEFKIHIFSLQANDVLILGSDGRDDLDIGTDEHGMRIINEDETQFLHRVEDGKGDLAKIFDSIQKFGALTDDLTLVRLAYRPDTMDSVELLEDAALDALKEGRKALKKENYKKAFQLFEEAYSMNRQNVELLRDLSIIAFRLKEYHKAAVYTEEYCELNPAESEFIYYVAYANKLIRNFKKAADHGERMRLRDPHHVNNLINLADIYWINGNLTRSENLIQAALLLDSANPNLKKLLEKIEKKKNSTVELA